MNMTLAHPDQCWRFPGLFVPVVVVMAFLGAVPCAAQTSAPATEELPSTGGTEIVEDFVAAFKNQDIEAIMSFFTEDAVYHNMPTEPANGIEAVRSLIESYVSTANSIEFEILAIAEVGSTVLTERVDRFIFGDRALSIPVMGAFEIRDGKISAWRDYFDMASFTRQLVD